MMAQFPYAPAAADVSRGRADALIAWLRDWAERAPDLRLMDERRSVSPKVILDLGNKGLFGLQIPESHGGLGLRHRDMHRIMVQLAAIDVSLASLLFIHNVNGVRPIADWATPEIRDEILPQIAAGRMLASFGLTEPAAGSDTTGLQTLAEPVGNGRWRITGVKRWNGSGWTGVITVFARERDARGRPGRITGYVFKTDEPGLRFGPETLTMGVRSIMQNGIVLQDAECDVSRIVGEHGKGMVVADETLLLARVYMGSMALGGMKRCLQLMHRFASRRKIGAMTLIDSPLTLRVLSRAGARIAVAEAVVDQLVSDLDDGNALSPEACMAAKILTTNWLGETADDLVQTLGGRGFMEQNLAPMIYRDVRMTRIGDGVNEVLELAIGRRLRHAPQLKSLFCDTLDAEGLYARLTSALDAAEVRCGAPDGSGADFARALAGAALCEALGVACLRARGAEADAESLAWASSRLETALHRCHHGTEEEPSHATRAALDTRLAAWMDDIGDIENNPPGVEAELDPLLRRAWGTSEHKDYAGMPGDHSQATEPTERNDGEARRDRAAALLRARLNAKAQ